MMDILDTVDCTCCEDYRVHRGRVHSEPDDCRPDEAECLQDAPDSGPCACMLDRLRNMILNGQLVTENGYFADRDWLLQARQGGIGVNEAAMEAMRRFSLEGALYWWIPDDLVGGMPVPFLTIEEVYGAVCEGGLCCK